ncbi:DUF6807 family protein [Arthrobacter agilis]|uniref:DUF6807 family protein n=1 Tax=Arthrobacter agilis TaxID=37921 RepID=UPI00277F48C9|nr:DUF6807 family protein [Arthrobacter agilis]MDQ0735720.1 hypothetical protein [Arthrobacter agilis]
MTGPTPVRTADGRLAGVLHDGGGEPAEHSPRPFLHPVSTPGGGIVSDYAPADHPWHWGLGIAVSTIAVAGQRHPVNLWGGPTYSDGQGYVQLPNNGSQRGATAPADAGVLQRLEWCAADGSAFLHEERTWDAETVRAGGADWVLTSVRSRWINTSAGVVAFGSPTTAGRPNAGYGGFFLRLAPSFDGADIVAGAAVGSGGPGSPTGSFRVTSGDAGSVSEEDAMGSRRAWLGLRSATASVLMVPAPGNPGGLSPWFVRSSGTPMLCAAPFFHAELRLGAGETFDWGWSLLVADGRMPDSAFVDAAGVAGAEHAGGPAEAARP